MEVEKGVTNGSLDDKSEVVGIVEEEEKVEEDRDKEESEKVSELERRTCRRCSTHLHTPHTYIQFTKK